MKTDQIIRIIFRSRSIMNDISELNSLIVQLEDLKNEQRQIDRNIAEIEKMATHGIMTPLIFINRRTDVQVNINKLTRMKSALEEKLRITIHYELSDVDQRGTILLDGAKTFYGQFKGNPISDDDSYVPRYDLWAIDFLEECLRIGYYNAEVYFLLGSLCLSGKKLQEAYNYFVDSLDIDDLYIRALEEKISVIQKLINEGEDWRKVELLKEQERFEKLISKSSDEE